MHRRPTPAEAAYPVTEEFSELARAWAPDGSRILLDLVWRGYDRLRAEVLDRIDCTQSNRDLERNITQMLEPRIRQASDPYTPFYVQHGPYEDESAVSSQAQPPQYDLAFVLYENERVMWPLEAKILRTDKRVAPYVKDVNEQFMTCRYSPFSKEGAMLGYLVKGNEDTALSEIAEKLNATLAPHMSFPQRPHRTSDHTRTVPAGKPYPADFRCHHLIFRLAA